MSVDPVGVVLGLPGLFTACVDCFNYVQFGRSFGIDYSNCLLALDVEKLRFSRWGAAVGISEERVPSLLELDEKEKHIVENLLESILEIFTKAENASARFEKADRLKRGGEAGDTALAVCSPDADLGLRYQTLHSTWKSLVQKRHKKSNVLQKAKWALYQKWQFEAMVAELRSFVNALEDLFPPGPKQELLAKREEELCEEEVAELKETTDLILLKEVVGENDLVVQMTADKALEVRGMGHLVENFKLTDSTTTTIGDKNVAGRESKSHFVRGFNSSGNSVLSIGNLNY